MAVEAMAVEEEAAVMVEVAEEEVVAAATPLFRRQKLFMRREAMAIPQNSIGFRRNGSPKTHSVKFGRREVTA
jgi:hypothetical protein